MSEQARPRAFAVWFKDMERWDVLSTRLNRSFKVAHPLTRLGDLVTVRWEVVPPDQLASGEVTMVDKVGFDGIVYAGNKQQTRMDQYLACPGDLLVSKIRARQGSVGLVSPLIGKVSASIHYRSLSPNPNLLDSTYAWLALRSSYCRAQFLAATGGAAKGEISETALLSAKVPLPPLPVQQSIVARWEAAQAEVQALRGRFLHTEGVTSRLVLDCLGLKRLKLAEVPKVFAVSWKEFERWSVSYNKAAQSGVDLALGKYPVVSLGSLSELVQYGTSEKANTRNEGVAVIRMNNIVSGELVLNSLKHLALSPSEIKSLRLEEGDILFNRTNSKELVGKCGVYHPATEDEVFVFASYLIRVRVKPNIADPDFVAYVVNSPLGRSQINAMSRQIIGQANVNSQELRSLQIPLPPLDVQREIVGQVQAQRQEMARLREQAERKARESKAEVEAWILGVKRPDELPHRPRAAEVA